MFEKTRRLLPVVALASLGLAACGEEEAGEACGFPDATELYALGPQIAGANSGEYNTYLTLTDRLAGEEEVDLGCSIELPGRALVIGRDGGGRVWVTGGNAPTITRYDVVDGALKKGPTINLTAAGVASIGEYAGQFIFKSDTKAYFFDGTGAQVVVWNPDAMEIIKTLPLPAEAVIPETVLSMTPAPVLRGDLLYMFPGWRTSTSIPSKAGVFIVDTATDELHTAFDDRCGYVRDGIFGADGYLYMATEAVGSARFRINPDSAPAPCMLRYDPVTGAFDPDFYVDLTTLFGGDAAGTLIRGPNDEAFLRVLDEDLVTVKNDTSPRDLASAPAWRWAKVTLEEEPKVEVMTEVPPAGGSVLLTFLDGEVYIPVITAGETRLVELTAEGPGETALRVQGRLFSAVKVK